MTSRASRTTSEAATRDVPVLRPLGRELAAHRLACPWTDGLVFGRTRDRPFAKTSVLTRARAAWAAANANRMPDVPLLLPIGLHQARHTCASTFIAAGANPKVTQKIMRHANIAMTFDRYGHMMPGGLEAAAARPTHISRPPGSSEPIATPRLLGLSARR